MPRDFDNPALDELVEHYFHCLRCMDKRTLAATSPVLRRLGFGRRCRACRPGLIYRVRARMAERKYDGPY